ncbi:putative tbc1 domain family member 10a protein [Zalerion maritima]|uniref:Tbc1 domain family member 10a protein n=1 Tax=Zalerion maritima TaxID=339359 RepID=A0AAD5RTZ0_9PEZI|nr:putative tbc1 domain family member 10a protein [Zalerion maritima]
MDQDTSAVPLERSTSQLSSASVRSARSSTVRNRPRRLASRVSSSASSVAASDKSLTSFPSFSPETPSRHAPITGSAISTASPDAPPPELSIRPSRSTTPAPAPTTVDRLTSISPELSARSALFDDSPLPPRRKVPGALHHADDAHIERLIARHGAVALVRQVAEDLAHRDAQISGLRRRAGSRERALRKIIQECGLSSLEIETRLRAVESDPKANTHVEDDRSGNGISDLMSDAMSETVLYNAVALGDGNDATIRAAGPQNPGASKGTLKGWKDYLWGGAGTAKKGSTAASSIDEENSKASSIRRTQAVAERRPRLGEDLFSPPETESVRSSSRASSTYSANQGRKTSLASLALRLVAGSSTLQRDTDSARGRASSVGQAGSVRSPSAASVKTTGSTRVLSGGGGPKALMGIRRPTVAPSAPVAAAVRSQTALERWEAGNSSPKSLADRQETYGPVEMDTIVPPETQPPTLNNYNRRNGSEYLTDRFGFIYDQRRKKRQREASHLTGHIKSNSRTEMLANGRLGFSPPSDETDPRQWVVEEEEAEEMVEAEDDNRVPLPSPVEDKPKRWQDYLRIATFPTELLSHTPSISADTLQVMEAPEQLPKSPGMPTSQERGFLPHASTTTPVLDNEVVPETEGESPGSSSATLVKEDAEPVKLLLQQLSEVHDMLQKEKTVRWNDFLRKVRAERRREGEAAAASGSRVGIGTAAMPETKLTDGEMIGVAGLGNKGKVGRAKWNEFKGLVLGGIPVSYRAKIWSECCGATGLRVPGYYDDLVSRGPEKDDPTIVSQIHMDINRTLTDNIFFRQGSGVAKLREVLLAYARRNPDVGYCQGMNLIAANLLLIMPSSEDAFWILAAFIEQILPGGYYDHSLLTSRADQQVLRSYVADVLPKLSRHLETLGVELEALTFQWFLSVFTDCLCAEALFRVWDVVLCTNDGSTFLFQVALALLKLNEQQLFMCKTPASVYTYINHQMTNHAISIDGLIHASEGLRRLVKREEVDKRRDNAVEMERGVSLPRALEEEEAGGKKTDGIAGDGSERCEPMAIDEAS